MIDLRKGDYEFKGEKEFKKGVGEFSNLLGTLKYFESETTNENNIETTNKNNIETTNENDMEIMNKIEIEIKIAINILNLLSPNPKLMNIYILNIKKGTNDEDPCFWDLIKKFVKKEKK